MKDYETKRALGVNITLREVYFRSLYATHQPPIPSIPPNPDPSDLVVPGSLKTNKWMVMKNRKDKVTSANRVELQSLAEALEMLEGTLRLFADVFQGTRFALIEAQRYRDAINNKAVPLNFDELIELVERSSSYDEVVIKALKSAQIARFELGKLWLSAANEFDAVRINFAKDHLLVVLKEKFGVDFKLRILQQDDTR